MGAVESVAPPEADARRESARVHQRYSLRVAHRWFLGDVTDDFPNFETVKTYFYKLQRDGTWERINDALRERVRQQSGREGEPSLLILDSQSVKTTEKGGRVATMEVSE
jgi:putative transposase